MKIDQALRVLKSHQAWRKGEDGYKPTTPHMLSRALEVAINLLETELSYCQCNRPMPNSKFGVFECMNCEKTMKP